MELQQPRNVAVHGCFVFVSSTFTLYMRVLTHLHIISDGGEEVALLALRFTVMWK